MSHRESGQVHAKRHHCRGFTLAEAIIVIVISGIVAAAVAVFIRGPVQAYFDTSARAELTDIADTALRRISRDVHAALPNSIRVLGTCDGVSACYLEFIPVVVGGRYRADVTSGGGQDPLLFNANDPTFDVLGPALTVPAGAWVVVYNLGVGGSDAYEGGANPGLNQNRRTVNAAVATNNVSLATTTRFPFESPAKRFQIVQQPVTYECNPAGGTLTRRWDYGFNAAQAVPAGGSNTLLANAVTTCAFRYDAQAVTGRAGLVLMSLEVTRNNETVSLAMQTHVSNVP